MMKEVDKLTELIDKVSEEINGILRTNLYEVGLNDSDLDSLKKRKSDLREALRNSGIGDVYAKRYVKQTIKNIIVSKLIVSSDDYDLYIPFGNGDKLSVREKFDILLYYFSLSDGEMALARMIDDYIFGEDVSIFDKPCIKETQIEELYDRVDIYLSKSDKLDILVQRIYSQYKGLGVIDDIRDMKIEGVSAGVSGRYGEPSTVWILYSGVSLHLAFLKFDSDRELERVCMNIYRYGSPGQLSKSKGYIVNEMKDNSRVVVVRPPFAENFAFFVRKFDTIENKNLEQLLIDEGWELVSEVLKTIIKGCQVSAITGAQGSGKTTLLMSLIGYIPSNFSLRIQEQAFELHLRQIYPMRNILTFRETEYVSGQEGLDIQKKTDGVVNILGEVASNEVAAWMIQMSQVASLFTLFTHHAKTTDNLVKYMRNALIINGNFNNERIALEQVVDAVRFDVHMERDSKGHRYIERISEIEQISGEELYRIRDVIRFDGKKYVLAEGFSKAIIHHMSKYLNEAEVKYLYENFYIQDK
ncbi:MAG: ATPase, T2SS/T4P/T4SS family [Lachnospiraceae bacterium]|nr:ATPase, T2SS/T4P/T4SS family [Lachnospiraceae bacterium]